MISKSHTQNVNKHGPRFRFPYFRFPFLSLYMWK